MLLNYNPTDPLYVIGKGVTAREIACYISKETGSTIPTVTIEEFQTLPDNSQCVMGFFDVELRAEFLKNIDRFQRRWPSWIHPTSSVVNVESIGQGIVIYSLSHIGYESKIGDFSILAVQTNIAHGVQLGRNAIVCPDTLIGGSTIVGDNVFFGQKCSIRDRIQIASNVTLYMNSVVTRSITEPGTYYGNRKALTTDVN